MKRIATGEIEVVKAESDSWREYNLDIMYSTDGPHRNVRVRKWYRPVDTKGSSSTEKSFGGNSSKCWRQDKKIEGILNQSAVKYNKYVSFFYLYLEFILYCLNGGLWDDILWIFKCV